MPKPAWRWIGILPWIFFGITTYDYLREGTPGNLLWVCNVCNLLLGASIILNWASGAWVATLWILIGTPLWIMDEFKDPHFALHSLLSHFVALAIGLAYCRSNPPEKRVWWKGVALLAILQLLSRALTHPELNVNVAFSAYGDTMPYLPYWLLSACGVALALAATEITLRKILVASRPAD